MLRFASPEWIAALDDAVRQVAVPSEAAGPLRVRYRFTDADGGAPVGYDVVLGDGPVRAERPAGEAAGGRSERSGVVTITQPLAVARSVAAGALAAQQALLAGDIRVEGPVVELVRWRPLLDALDAASASLRARTTWDG